MNISKMDYQHVEKRRPHLNTRVDHIGETCQMKNGLVATIIDYIGTNNITVRFENGSTKRSSYKMFKDRCILSPLGFELYTLDDGIRRVKVTNPNIGVSWKMWEDDLPILAGGLWHIDSDGYVISGHSEKLHRLIIGARKGEEVDHIDHDPANNCRDNLRIVNTRENLLHKRMMKTNKTGFTGVLFNPKHNNYKAYIWHGKHIWLGTFRTPEEAARAHDNAVMQYRSVELENGFAKLNFSEERYSYVLQMGDRTIFPKTYEPVFINNVRYVFIGSKQIGDIIPNYPCLYVNGNKLYRRNKDATHCCRNS